MLKLAVHTKSAGAERGAREWLLSYVQALQDHKIINYNQYLTVIIPAVRRRIVQVIDFRDPAQPGRQYRRLLTKWLLLFRASPRIEILQKIEGAAPISLEQKPVLQLLPARYGFIWREVRMPREALHFDVAARSHAWGIPSHCGFEC